MKETILMLDEEPTSTPDEGTTEGGEGMPVGEPQNLLDEEGGKDTEEGA